MTEARRRSILRIVLTSQLQRSYRGKETLADHQPLWQDRPYNASLLRACAGIAALGCLVSAVSNIVGSLIVPNYSFFADTISDLGSGPHEIYQDLGMYGFAIALNACAIAAAHLHAGTDRWSAGVVCLAVMAGLVVIIAARNEYGDRDREGIVIHTYLVVALGGLFPAAVLFLRRGFASVRRGYGLVSLVCAVTWIVCAPVFFVIPTEMDGLWERGLALIMIVWVLVFAKIMLDAAAHFSGDAD